MFEQKLAEMRIHNEERKRIKAAATEKPWIREHSEWHEQEGYSHSHENIGRFISLNLQARTDQSYLIGQRADFRFITYARNDEVENEVDTFLDEVERLRARLGEMGAEP